jgi:hypothetical protein
MHKPNSIELDAAQLVAVDLAIHALKQLPDLARKKKNLRNYALRINQDAEYIYVYFRPRRSKDVYFGSGNEYGRHVVFTVDKKRLRLYSVFTPR